VLLLLDRPKYQHKYLNGDLTPKGIQIFSL